MGKDGVLQRCLDKVEAQIILKACYDEPYGGHFIGYKTAHKILLVGYWWSTLDKEAFDYYKQCDACQQMVKPTKSRAMPLNPILPLKPFKKWGINFVGPFEPTQQRQKPVYSCMYRLCHQVV